MSKENHQKKIGIFTSLLKTFGVIRVHKKVHLKFFYKFIIDTFYSGLVTHVTVLFFYQLHHSKTKTVHETLSSLFESYN